LGKMLGKQPHPNHQLKTISRATLPPFQAISFKFGKKSIFAILHNSFSASRKVSVEIGKYGRIVLPKKIRQKYGMEEGIRLIITEYNGRVCLIPVKKYEKPTEAIVGSIKVDKPIDDPKGFARDYIRKKLLEEL